uniref:F-box protein PP2-B10-like n=1 Tax=Erigeron canadensis TaxID=72917 RepID=UPI001CB9A1B1|nr:F-box protein PP2-B10-like [Erigeron canadensis]
MKRRLMIPASSFLDPLDWELNSVPLSESRFKVVTKSLRRHSFGIRLRVDSQLLSPQTTYSCLLIYKLSDNYSSYEGPLVIGVNDGVKSHMFPLSICLSTHCHPPVIGVKDDQRSAGSLDIFKMKGHPKHRKDGWMQVKFSEVSIPTMNTYYIFSVEEKEFRNTSCFGIVIEGIEFRIV